VRCLLKVSYRLTFAKEPFSPQAGTFRSLAALCHIRYFSPNSPPWCDLEGMPGSSCSRGTLTLGQKCGKNVEPKSASGRVRPATNTWLIFQNTGGLFVLWGTVSCPRTPFNYSEPF